MTQATRTTTVFVGSASQMEQMLAAGVSQPMIATGNIGLYGHLSGVFDMVVNDDMTALTQEWAGTAPGVLEQGEDTVVAKQSVTIRNNGAAAITIPVGTLVSTSSGTSFQILEERQPGADWVSGVGTGDGSFGGYVIEPGASITVIAEATQDGAAGNVLANAINTIAGINGAQITASLPEQAAWTLGTGTVTLANTTGTTAQIWVGTALTGTTGSFVVGNNPAAPGYVAALPDQSAGYYLVAAGASLTVPVFSTNAASASTALGVIELQNAENAPAGSITGGSLPKGVTVAASSAIVQGGVTSPSQNGTFGADGPDTGRVTMQGQDILTTTQGFDASEANVNVDYNEMWTSLDLQNWESYVDAERALGVMNVAPVWGDNQIAPFGTADEAANVRAAALYGGGLAFDMPSEYVLQVAAILPGYIPAMVSEIKWANSEGLRTSIIISPLDGTDPSILENTKTFIALLQANGALPSQFIVENYAEAPAASGTYFSTSSAESLNGVATYLAGLTLTPSTSESGLELAGHASADDIITGLKTSQSVAGTSTLSLFAGTQVFAAKAATTMTVTVSLSVASLGQLANTGGGSLSANGASFTASGTAAQVQADLNALSFSASAGGRGTETITASILDAAGTISGTTAILVDDALSLTGLAASITIAGGGAPFAAAIVSEGAATVPLTATVSLSSPTDGSLWNIGNGSFSDDGAVLNFTGTAAQIQADLRALSYIPTGVPAQTVASITLADGMDTLSASEAISVTQTAMTISGLPSTYVSAPFGVDAPFQDVLLAAANASAISTATVSLPSGAASLVSTSGGSLSSNGLAWTATGTVAQIQADLRGLTVSVPALSTRLSEQLMLTLNGQTTAITLSVQSTDTVYTGSSAAMDPLIQAAVTAPLLATGKIGLYGQEGGVTASAYDTSLPKLATTWSGTGAGTGQLVGASLIVAEGTVTLRNSSSAAIEVPVGTIVSTASGVSFSVTPDLGGSYPWQEGSAGSAGNYLVAAGSSMTVPVEATQDGASGNILANALTQIQGVAGLTVTASTLTAAAWAMGSGTVTLTNTGSSAQTIYEGYTVTGSGGTYQIGNNPAAAGFVSGDADNSTGWYVIQPGKSLTVPIFSTGVAGGSGNATVLAIAAENAPANSITGTGTLPAGIAVTGSSAITTVGATSSSMQDSFGSRGVGTGILTDSGYGQIYTSWSLPQSEIDVAPPWSMASALDLANWQGYVNNARALGVMNVAEIISMPYTNNFATSAMTQWIRAAALYGGGIGFEQSPLTCLTIGASFIAKMAAVYQWAAAHGLRSTLILDPSGDGKYAEDSMTLLADLKADGGMPSQVIVSGAVNASQPAAEQSNGVAVAVAALNLTPSASESGLNTTGLAAAKSIMTGVAPAQTALGAGASQPYAQTQVFAQSASDSMTATVALVSTTLGRLAAGGAGTVSADGSTFTVAGTPAAITTALQLLSFTPTAGASGIETLNLSIADAAGTIQGATALTVDNSTTLSGLVALQGITGPASPLSALVVSNGVQGAQLTATVTLTGSVAASIADAAGGTISSNGTSLTVTGTAATVQSVLGKFSLTPAPAASGTDTLSVAVTDGTATTTATTTVAISPPPYVIIGPGVTTSLYAGETLYDEGYGNTLVLPAAGPVNITGNTANNGDVFDLRAAMASTSWNGSLASLGSYLTASPSANGRDLNILLHPTGGASSTVLATLLADGTAGGAFQRFEQHALLTISASQPGSVASHPTFISGPGVFTTLTAGELVYDTGMGNTLILPASGSVSLTGNTVNNGDTFDLRAAMATTNWDGKSADLGNYVTSATTNGGQDLQILLHPTGGSASSVLATLLTAGPSVGAFTRFEQHAVF